MENETVHDVTVNVLDGETGNLVEWVHVGGHGSSAEDFRRLPTEITVGVDAVGFAQTYYPSGLRNVLVGNADSIGLEVGTDGLQPFAHSGVDPSPC